MSFPVKPLRSPNCNTDNSRNSWLSLNIFYFATGDTQKDSGLEIEFMLDTEASCSILNYRTFWKICQLQHPITIQTSIKVTKTYSRQTVPMIGYANITFSYYPDGQFIFPLAVWITDMRTQNLLQMDFGQKTSFWISFWSTWHWNKETSEVNLLWKLSPKQILSSNITNFDYENPLNKVYWC